MASYRTLCTRFYDLDKPEPPDVGLRFYAPYLKAANGPVIELMCGSGRYMKPFLSAGYDVDGVDASPEMLDACRVRISATWPDANIFLQGIENLDLPRPYELAIVTSGSLSLLTDLPTVARSLKSVFYILRPGATFVGEIQGADPARPSDQSSSTGTVATEDGGEIRLNTTTTYDADTRIETDKTRYRLIKNDKTLQIEDEKLGLRHYEEAEFFQMLADAGFERIRFSTAYPDTALEDMGGVLLFECKRPE